MSLIGSVGLTNNQNGLYLGSVNVDNADEFALTSNSIYVNDNVKTIQSGVDSVTQADVIYISSGSYGELVTITDKYNIALNGPSTASTICEILNGVKINGTSELIRLSNLQIKGANSQIYGVGRQRLNNIVFTGTSSQTHTVQFGKDSTKYMTIQNCEFDNYCSVVISNTFGSSIYFINCNFGGATLTLSQASPLQVILNNCSGLVSYPSNATYIGLNVLTTGVSRTDTTNLNISTINNASYPPASSGVSVTNQSNQLIPFCTSTNNTLDCSSNFNYNSSTSTLSVPNVTLTNINGTAYDPLSANAQANNRIVTGTTTNNLLHCNQDATWDGTQLSLFNSSALNIGRGNNPLSAASNLAIGYQALNAINTGTNNTALGYQALLGVVNNSNNVAVGASQTSGTLTSSAVLIGSGVNSNTDNSVVIGYLSKGNNSGIVIGSSSGRAGGGSYNIVIGRNSMTSLTASNSSYNVILGSGCFNGATTSTALYNNLFGVNASPSITSGAQNCCMGTNTGQLITTHNNNTIIGHSSFTTGTGYNNCSSLGANINVISGDNQVQLGDSATNTYIYGTIQTRSDFRDKNYIGDLEYGLDFINELRPVKYKYNYREDYKKTTTDDNGNLIVEDIPLNGTKTRKRWHWGLIAQEVEGIMNKKGFDCGLLQHHTINGGEDRYSLGYEEFIAPLIKAVQELTKQNLLLEKRISILESK